MESYEGKYRNTRRYPAKAGSADMPLSHPSLLSPYGGPHVGVRGFPARGYFICGRDGGPSSSRTSPAGRWVIGRLGSLLPKFHKGEHF